MPHDITDIMAATVRITTVRAANGAQAGGSGYLVGHGRIGTALHVVQASLAGSTQVVFDGGTQVAAELEHGDPATDCAVLRLLGDAPTLARALPLGGPVRWKAPFDGYGFPSAAKRAGVTFDGIVSNPHATDDLEAPVLELTSGAASAGMAAPLHGFSGSPVVVDGMVVGHLKRFIPDPSDPLRPAYGKVYACRIEAMAALLQRVPGLAMPAQPPVDRPAPGSLGQEADHRKVLDMVGRWQAEGRLTDRARLDAAESLIQLAAPEQALKLLAAAAPSVRHTQLTALAHAKHGSADDIERALQLLEPLRRQGQLDPETGGLLGGRYKQRWLLHGDAADLEHACDAYQQAFAETGDHYPGINVAALMLWRGDRTKSAAVARQVRDTLLAMPAASMDAWHMASLAEAHLLCGDLQAARTWYGRAAAQAGHAVGTLRIMREQMQRHLQHLGLPGDVLQGVLDPLPTGVPAGSVP